jgi:hypothetical protein
MSAVQHLCLVLGLCAAAHPQRPVDGQVRPAALTAEEERLLLQRLFESFRAGRDAEALALGDRLLQLGRPGSAPQGRAPGAGMPAAGAALAGRLPTIAAIVGDLRLRRERGTFGKTGPEKLPDDFGRWDRARQVAFLIDALGSLNDRLYEESEPPAVNHQDWRVSALLRAGEAAVPALLVALEKDERLTRTVFKTQANFMGILGPFGFEAVLPVRKVVAPVLFSIWRVSRVPTETSPRRYWEGFGPLPFEERMLRVLRDRRLSVRARCEAAENLAYPGAFPLRGFPMQSWPHRDPGRVPGAPRPALMKYQNPTAAEAIVAAIDDAGEVGEDLLFPLIALGDRRITPELTRRAD